MAAAGKISRIAKAMAWAEARGRDKGLRGASSAWLAVWVLASGYRHIKRMAAPEPVVVREALRPGEQLLITHYRKGDEPEEPPTSPKRRRRRSLR